MYRLQLTAFGIIAGTGLLLSRLLVADGDPRLKPNGYDFEWDGKPAYALVYSLFTNHRPKLFFMVWNGKRLGSEYQWHDNGQLMVERPHRGGLPDGLWKVWYEDGSPKSLQFFKDGVIDGESWGWHPNGQVSDYNQFAMGQEITHKSWVSDGTPYYNYVYQDGHKVGMKGGEFCKRLEVLNK